jgi:hypothetical protein
MAYAAASLRGEGGGLTLGKEGASASSVKAEMVVEEPKDATSPFRVAVTLTTRPEWHIYWSNPGEGGVATSFAWDLPAGYKVEPLAFPVPQEFVQPGDIHVLGYEGATTFLFRVVPAADGKAGKIAVAASWLCCNKDLCVPGKASLELAPPADEAHKAKPAFLAAAKERIPADAPPGDVVGIVSPPYAVEGAAEQWRLQIGWTKLPKQVEAFPPAVEGLNMTVAKVSTGQGNPRAGPLASLNRALAGASVVEFKSHVYSGQTVKVEKIPLLIAYTGEDGKRRGFYVDLDAAAIGAQKK